MPLFRLAYCSSACDPTQADLEAILSACERNNAAAHVTGMLLFDSGAFLQLLEGPRAAVTARFLRIAQDPRHVDLEVLVAGPVDARLFADWRMHYVSSRGAGARALLRFAEGPGFSPRALSTGALEGLFHDMALRAAEAAGPRAAPAPAAPAEPGQPH